MGRALAREVGQEDDAAGAGRAPPRPPPSARSNGTPGRERVARPLQRAGGREHHAHGVPGCPARHGRTRARAPAHRAGTRAGRRTRRPRCRARARPGPGRSTPTPSAAAAQSPAPAAIGTPRGRAARDLGRLQRARHPALRHLQRLQHGRREAALGDVEEQRAGGVGDVDRTLAAEPQAHVVLGQQHVADARVDIGLVRAQPQQLRGGEARQRAVARQRDQPLEADPLLDLGALGRRALVVPEDRAGAGRAPARRAPRGRASGPRGRCPRSRGDRARRSPPRCPPTSPRAPAPTSPAAAARGRSGSRRARRPSRRPPPRAP